MRVEHAAGDELQGVTLTAHDDRVAGVVTTLVAHHVGVLLGEQIDDLRLALVTPLGADDDGDRHVPGHYPDGWGQAPTVEFTDGRQ